MQERGAMKCERCGQVVRPLSGRCRVCGNSSRFWRAVVGWSVISAASVKLLMIFWH